MRPFGVVCLLLLAGLSAPAAYAAAPPDTVAGGDLVARFQRLSLSAQDDVRWLARCLFSEADRVHEQRLVAWVVRNRVETGYRGRTYREVVLSNKQFSAFNEPTPRRAQILAYDEHSTAPLWRQSLRIALEVYEAPSSERPFPTTVRHFYSPVSMPRHSTPDWAEGIASLDSKALGVDPFRFRFFDDVDEGSEGGGLVDLDVVTASERMAKHGADHKAWRASRVRAPRLSGRVSRPARPVVQRPTRQ